MTAETEAAQLDILESYRRPFDLSAYLQEAIPQSDLLNIPEYRRELTKLDPLLFALIYLPHHLCDESTQDQITFSDFHLDLCEQALQWVKPLSGQARDRDAYIAPRGCGKSTWCFLILPLWAAAHQHIKFIAAFADAAAQAEEHLATFKGELDRNTLLQQDYSALCEPAKGTKVARQLANSRGQIKMSNGFVFMSRGIDSAVAGMKVASLRPQLLLLDDVEPAEESYSPVLMKKRLTTLLDNILPLNIFARVIISGTVTMPGSIIHQLVRSLTSSEPEAWIEDEHFRAHYYPAIITNDDGTERSLWPDKWALPELQKMRHTRSFQKNYMNSPISGTGTFWSEQDIRQGKQEHYGSTILWIDPAVTSKKSSDFTGLAVLSLSLGNKKPLYVRHAIGVRLPPAALRERVYGLLSSFEDISRIVIESNQGADVWLELFKGCPVPVQLSHSSAAKELRIQRALVSYQKGDVLHADVFSELVAQQLAYPEVVHDDVIDAVSTGIGFILDAQRRPTRRRRHLQRSYA